MLLQELVAKLLKATKQSGVQAIRTAPPSLFHLRLQGGVVIAALEPHHCQCVELDELPLDGPDGVDEHGALQDVTEGERKRQDVGELWACVCMWWWVDVSCV